MIYVGFWRRFAALCLDGLCMSPLVLLMFWGEAHYRLFDMYFLIPSTAIGFAYGVCLVQRYGGTPGKRLMSIRIVRANGEPVTFRTACLRYFVVWVVGLASSVALMISAFQLTDACYFAASSGAARALLLKASTPAWYGPVQWGQFFWFLSAVIVMLANKERRTIHDFIAGTVVIEDAQPAVPEECSADKSA